MTQTYSGFTGTTASFVANGGVYSFDFSTVGVATVFLEGQTAAAGQPFVANRVLNAYRMNGTVTANLGPGTYRLNNLGPAVATVTVTGP
jgi:hypothetical protein